MQINQNKIQTIVYKCSTAPHKKPTLRNNSVNVTPVVSPRLAGCDSDERYLKIQLRTRLAVPGTVIVTPSEECLLGFGLVWYLDNDIGSLVQNDRQTSIIKKRTVCGGITYQTPCLFFALYGPRMCLKQ